MSKYPFTQHEHDEAVGIGCLVALVAMAPVLIAVLAAAVHAVMMCVAALMVAL